MLRPEDLMHAGDPSVHFATSAEIADIQRAATLAHGAVRELDGRGIGDENTLLAMLGQALDFPDYYGANWDAFEECLRDFGDAHPDGCILVVRHARGVWNRVSRPLGLLVAIWLSTVELLTAAGIPLHLVFVLEDSGVAAPD